MLSISCDVKRAFICDVNRVIAANVDGTATLGAEDDPTSDEEDNACVKENSLVIAVVVQLVFLLYFIQFFPRNTDGYFRRKSLRFVFFSFCLFFRLVCLTVTSR